MSDDHKPVADDPDDRPIEVIRALRREPRPGFLERLRRKIDRRFLVGDFADAFLLAPILLLVHFLEMIYGVVNQGKNKGESV